MAVAGHLDEDASEMEDLEKDTWTNEHHKVGVVGMEHEAPY